MHAKTFSITAAASLLLATPALANRAGDAPIKAPLNSKTHHVAFTLPGSGWKQQVGVSGTPAFGRYARDAQLADGTVCTLIADVVAKTSARPFRASGDTVQLRPFSQFPELLHIAARGKHGPVTWWSGTIPSRATLFDAAAGGTQRLPAGMRTKAKPYLNYNVRMLHASPRAGDPCASIASKQGASIARTIAGTMRIATGPPVSKPPFASA
jgi:hypothetical protein